MQQHALWLPLFLHLPLSVLGGGGLLEALTKSNITCLMPSREGTTLTEQPQVDQTMDRAFHDLLDYKMATCDEDETYANMWCKGTPPGAFCFRKKVNFSGTYKTCYTMRKKYEICPAGFYCVGELDEPVVCRKGFHCPVGSVNETICPAGSYCPVASLSIQCNASEDAMYSGVECLADDTGRTVMPKPCRKGHYCVDGVVLVCPKDHYCPEGAGKPMKCGKADLCPEGSASPTRYPRATVQYGFIIGILLFFSLTGKWWCLEPKYYWVRLLMAAGGLIALWIAETSRGSRVWWTPTLFATSTVLLLAWGVYGSGRIQRLLGGSLQAKLAEPLAVSVMFLAMGWFFGDLSAGVFVSILLPAVLVVHDVCVNEMAEIFKIGLVLAGCVVILLATYTTSSSGRSRARFYALAVPLVVLYRLVTHWLTQWRQRPPAPPSSLGGDSVTSTWSEASSARGSSASPVRKSGSRRSQTEDFSEVEMGGIEGIEDNKRSSETSETPLQEGPSAAAHSQPGVGFRLEDVSLLLPPANRAILHHISLTIPSGSTVAVMGPSGCGKSSITNVLSGRAGYGKVTGSIIINGEHGRGRGINELRSVTGFVPQDDVMHRNMTVEENVRFSAELRLPRGNIASIVERGQQVVDEASQALDSLGLGDEALRNTLIGDENVKGVSGGQRKRVSIAMELVSKPWLLFLDEPTSGLDSTTSHAVVGMFTNAARASGCTTLAVVHQPRWETLQLFSRLILLAAGGYLVYSGPTSGVEDYFTSILRVTFPEKANPADMLLDAITLESAQALMESDGMLKCRRESRRSRQDFGQWLSDVWSTSPITEEGNIEVPLPPLLVSTCNWGEEVFVQMKRAAVQSQRDWMQIVGNLVLMSVGLILYCVCAFTGSPEAQAQHPVMALFLLQLTQGVSALRIFGGNGRYVVWREAGCKVSTPLCFLGRDLTAMAEIVLAAGTFAAIYFVAGPLLCSFHTLFWVAFCFIYASFGLNYIWGVLLSQDIAQMMAVVSTFLAFLFVGMQPSFTVLAQLEGGIGLNLMALSPMRWALGMLTYDHALRKGSVFTNKMVVFMAGANLENSGLPISWIMENGWNCGNPASSCRSRWLGDPDKGIPMISVTCTTTQMVLLGLFYRAAAILCMMVTSQLKSQGGGSLFGEDASLELDEHHHQSRSWWPRGKLLKDLLACFAVITTDLLMSVLLETI